MPGNMGLLLFDVERDGDLDLYLVSGSNEFAAGTGGYQDQLLINDGHGNFTSNEAALPENHTSKSCVKAADFDKDGDLDLFIGGRVLPGKYPTPVSSFIYRNDSKNSVVKFTDVTRQLAPQLVNIGMVCDGLWTDFDDDGWTDLILAGEWMPLTFLKNQQGKFEDLTRATGIEQLKGWWNSLAGGDFDNDGDIDYIVGNLGENSFYRASQPYPVNIYAKDYDNNGAIDAITTVYLKDEKGKMREFTAQSRDDINNQLPGVKKKFLTYKDFGKADFAALFSKAEREGELHLGANYLKTVLLKNSGNGKFEVQPLPEQAQLAPVYGIAIDDYNNDGNIDAMLVGNDYGTEVSTGRYDAFDGLLLLGNGKNAMQPQTILQSGFFVPGDAKALVKLSGNHHQYLLAASQNRGELKLFENRKNNRLLKLEPDDLFAILYYQNGQKRKEEFYYGSSFLSQSSRLMVIPKGTDRIEIHNAKSGRTIKP